MYVNHLIVKRCTVEYLFHFNPIISDKARLVLVVVIYVNDLLNYTTSYLNCHYYIVFQNEKYICSLISFKEILTEGYLLLTIHLSLLFHLN